MHVHRMAHAMSAAIRRLKCLRFAPCFACMSMSRLPTAWCTARMCLSRGPMRSFQRSRCRSLRESNARHAILHASAKRTFMAGRDRVSILCLKGVDSRTCQMTHTCAQVRAAD
jgi:hypothetical protein